jgi:plasmid stability protein
MKKKPSFREQLQRPWQYIKDRKLSPRSWQYIKDRTGFFAYADAEGKIHRGKTLWDWMQLLVIPAMLAVVSLWFSYSNRQSDMATAEQRLQEEKLNAYLAKMEGYILDWDLLSSKDQEDPAIVQLAQVQTATALRSMDKERRDLVFQFLHDSELIYFVLANASLADIDLNGADLSEAYLVGANLTRTWPAGAYWRGATYDDSTKWPPDFTQSFDPEVATKK